MSGGLRWDGMAEFKDALRRLPEELKAEAESLVKTTAELATAEIAAGYAGHVVTGDLASHVSNTAVFGNTWGVRYLVRSAGALAWIFESGTQARHYITKKGKTHVTGRMPPHPVFFPAMRRARRRMNEQLKALLVRHGLLVSGDAAA